MRIIETKVYRFKELDEQAKQSNENNREIFVEDSWWDFVEYDLKGFGLKLEEFDLGRRDYVKLGMYYALDTICAKILENCGTQLKFIKC